MEKEIYVNVSREGNITMTVPESANVLSYEQSSLITALIKGAMDDSKILKELWAKQNSILKPYNSLGRKVSDIASKLRDIEPEKVPEISVPIEKEKEASGLGFVEVEEK